MQDAIKVMQQSLMQSVNDHLRLDVRRAYIVSDSLKEARKEKFNPHKFVKVSTVEYTGPQLSGCSDYMDPNLIMF